MKYSCEKDFYAIVGVAPDATEEEIRSAYLSRARILHPDRFNFKQQPQDWKKANDMLAELNEAYMVLRNASDRAQYDDFRSGEKQPRPTPSSAPSQSASATAPFEHNEPKSGYAIFDKLSERIQLRLLKRQENKGEDQFQVEMESIAWNYVYICVLLLWFIYLFANVNGERWTEDTVYWYAGITFVAGALIGRNCVTIVRWKKAKLKPYFYITPLYFIRTHYDMVLFWPIWMLKNVSVTHNYKNGCYQSSTVVLNLGNSNHTVKLYSKGQVDFMFERIKTYEVRLRTALANSNNKYISDNDDFYQVPYSEKSLIVLLSKGKRAFIYSLSLLFCGAAFLGAILINEELSHNVYAAMTGNSSGQPETARLMTVDEVIQRHGGQMPTSQRVVSPSYPEQPLPLSGSVQVYTMAERIAPFEIKAARGNNYLLKLVVAGTDTPVLTVFVRSGTTVEIEVPLGTYEVRYAAGQTWYGYEHFFGENTAYTKADKSFTFEVVGNEINGFTITLYKVAHGNLTTSSISANEF